MNIYTMYTPSHKILYNNFFLKTLPKNFKLQVFEDKEQLCRTGKYYSSGWSETTKKKIDIFIRACEENMGDYFFYSDVDVQFFSDTILDTLIAEIQDYDIACQDDIIGYCSGLFICKANDKTLNMFKSMKNNFDSDDQKTLNKYLFMCKHNKLSRKFFTSGFIVKMWYGQDFIIPDNIIMHHANWTRGVNNKIKLLNLVKSKYDKINYV